MVGKEMQKKTNKLECWLTSTIFMNLYVWKVNPTISFIVRFKCFSKTVLHSIIFVSIILVLDSSKLLNVHFLLKDKNTKQIEWMIIVKFLL